MVSTVWSLWLVVSELFNLRRQSTTRDPGADCLNLGQISVTFFVSLPLYKVNNTAYSVVDGERLLQFF